MTSRTVVVDGSNIATEGRQMPSLAQLDEAVRAYTEEHPDDEIIVVVDATFAHRISDDERPMYEEAAAHNELVYPPAGAVGRGDAFLLRIAEKTGAIVLSNDSFQEFHGEHDWLFEKDRLIGGTPVPGVGWIFVPRTPVRGPKSREAVKEAKRTRARVGSKEASQPMPVPKAPPPGPGRGKKAKKAAAAAGDAIAVATEEAVTGGGDGKKRKRRKRRSGKSEPAELPTLNEPLTFIEFIAEHKLGTTVVGEVESFASHGAFVLVGDARCYVPLSAMGDPPPRSAKEVVKKGEMHDFVVQALDASRRGIELALPGMERISGTPTEETVEAEIAEAPEPVHREERRDTAGGRRRGSTRRATEAEAGGGGKPTQKTVAEETAAASDATAEKVSTKKPTAKKASTGKKAAAKKTTTATKTAAKKATVKKASTTEKATTEKAATKKAAAKKASTADKAVTKKAAAKKTGAKKTAVKKAPATDVAPKKAAAKKTAVKKSATEAAGKKAAAKKTSAKKASGDKAAVKKASAKKASPARAAAKKSLG